MLYYTQTLVGGVPMNKKTIIFWLIYAAILIFLYILSATDLIIKENEARVYPISVLVDGISGENYANMKKGMDEAAYENNVDMRFPAVAENITMEEKLEIAEDEIEAGAVAIIIGNRWKDEIADKIRMRHKDFPVLILGSSKKNESIYIDYDKIVKNLSENIVKVESKDNKLCIVSEDFSDEDFENVRRELKRQLEPIGYKFEFAEGEGPKLEKQLKAFGKSHVAFVSLDKESTVRVVKYVSDNNFNTAIYATGATTYLLGKLEEGEIKGIVAWNEYDMGYFMIDKLMRMLTDKGKITKDEIAVFYITTEDLKNEDYIKMLYPING